MAFEKYKPTQGRKLKSAQIVVYSSYRRSQTISVSDYLLKHLVKAESIDFYYDVELKKVRLVAGTSVKRFAKGDIGYFSAGAIKKAFPDAGSFKAVTTLGEDSGVPYIEIQIPDEAFAKSEKLIDSSGPVA